jgi:hypothetical protein
MTLQYLKPCRVESLKLLAYKALILQTFFILFNSKSHLIALDMNFSWTSLYEEDIAQLIYVAKAQHQLIQLRYVFSSVYCFCSFFKIKQLVFLKRVDDIGTKDVLKLPSDGIL